MDNKNVTCDDSLKTEKKIYHLDEINKKLLQTFRARRKINKLFNLYSKNLNDLNEMSKIIKPEAVNKTKFNHKILRLIKQSENSNIKTKIHIVKNKNTLSEILKNMGKKVIKELFLKDTQLEFLSKSYFRRFIEVRVKSFLGKDFVDFECVSHIHLFEKMKKSLHHHPLLNLNNKIANAVRQNLSIKEKENLLNKDKITVESKDQDEYNIVIDDSKIENKSKSFPIEDKLPENENDLNKNETVELTDKNKTSESDSNFLSNNTQDDILNIIINDKGSVNSDLEEKRERIFYLIQCYKKYYPGITADKMILIVNEVEKELNGLCENKNIFQIVEEKLNLHENQN